MSDLARVLEAVKGWYNEAVMDPMLGAYIVCALVGIACVASLFANSGSTTNGRPRR